MRTGYSYSIGGMCTPYFQKQIKVSFSNTPGRTALDCRLDIFCTLVNGLKRFRNVKIPTHNPTVCSVRQTLMQRTDVYENADRANIHIIILAEYAISKTGELVFSSLLATGSIGLKAKKKNTCVSALSFKGKRSSVLTRRRIVPHVRTNHANLFFTRD